MNDYNRLAWVYDKLAYWVFRGNILKSQTHFLPLASPNDRILIIGGGTGQVLEAIDQLKIPLSIDFIEPSLQMIGKAKRRAEKLSNLNVKFYQNRFQSFESSHRYEWIFCFYFLDLFKVKTLNSHLEHIKKLMNGQSSLVVADFENRNGRVWQKVLSMIMHAFFNLATSLESKQLKDIDQMIMDCGFCRSHKAYFFSQFIFSAVYQKEVSENGNYS